MKTLNRFEVNSGIGSKFSDLVQTVYFITPSDIWYQAEFNTREEAEAVFKKFREKVSWSDLELIVNTYNFKILKGA